MVDIPFSEHLLGLILGAIVTYFFRSISTALHDLKEEVKELHFSLARYESMDREILEIQSNIKTLFSHSTDLQSSVAVLEARIDGVVHNKQNK